MESVAINVEDIILEMRSLTSYERQGRLIDQDETASMEREKTGGVFLISKRDVGVRPVVTAAKVSLQAAWAAAARDRRNSRS